MSEEKKLKPCPFCGYKNAKVTERWSRHWIPYYVGEGLDAESHVEVVINIRANVICNKCHAKGGTAVGNIKGDGSMRESTKERFKIEEHATIKQRAVDNWNRRTNND